MNNIDVKAWQARLEQTFNEDGNVGPRLSKVVASELAYGDYVNNRMRGYVTLADSFQSFFYDTLVDTNDQYHDKDSTKEAPYHPTYLLSQLTVFRSIRAAENLLYLGYPLDGLSLLRDIKDRAIFFAALFSGFTTWSSLKAAHLVPAEGDQSIEASRAWRRACQREENRILKLMLREDNDFEEPIKSDLQTWEDFFNLELHGSRLTTATAFRGWAKGDEPLSIAPVPNDRAIAGYLNRAGEVFWMVHRTLPFLQLRKGAFGQIWAEKWSVLDDSFRMNQVDLFNLGIGVAKAVEVFIDHKFPFTPATIYIERDQPATAKKVDSFGR